MRKIYRAAFSSGFWLGVIVMGFTYNVAAAIGLPPVTGRLWVIILLVVAVAIAGPLSYLEYRSQEVTS